MSDNLYTVVQHSAYVGKGDPQFRNGLESKSITAKQAEKVHKVGGRVFGSYSQAEDFAEAEMYPDGYSGITPAARGKFTTVKIDGFPIYRPLTSARHDENGKAYIAYYRNDATTGFIWSGFFRDEVQVTREMGEPVIDTFAIPDLPPAMSPTDLLRTFQQTCDTWLEAQS